MNEIPFDYINTLAEQTIMISSLLGGFSISIIANLLTSDSNTKLHKYILASSTLAACFFLITVFSMTNLFLKTTNGYPFSVDKSSFELPRILGAITFYLGVIALLTLISLAGWTKSKKMGVFTTVIGVVTFIITFLMTAI